MPQKRQGGLIASLVVAGFAAGVAVHQAIRANANVDHGLAETAVFFALATVFRLLTLGATVSCGAGSGTHGANVSARWQTIENDLGNRGLRGIGGPRKSLRPRQSLRDL